MLVKVNFHFGHRKTKIKPLINTAALKLADNDWRA
jgi:hypothetical protein